MFKTLKMMFRVMTAPREEVLRELLLRREKKLLLLREYAERGNMFSQYILGGEYLEGPEIIRDYGLATRFFRMAAEQGHAEAQVKLSLIYSIEGLEGVEQNYDESVRWCRMAAEKGYAKAQLVLGIMYHEGVMVERNNDESIHWYRLAAEQGYAKAQHNLGNAYKHKFKEDGITFFYDEAFRWLRLAAEQGETNAQMALCRMYLTEGAEYNEREAYIWLYIAKVSGVKKEIGAKYLFEISRIVNRLISYKESISAGREAERRFAEIKERRERHLAEIAREDKKESEAGILYGYMDTKIKRE